MYRSKRHLKKPPVKKHSIWNSAKELPWIIKFVDIQENVRIGCYTFIARINQR